MLQTRRLNKHKLYEDCVKSLPAQTFRTVEYKIINSAQKRAKSNINSDLSTNKLNDYNVQLVGGALLLHLG